MNWKPVIAFTLIGGAGYAVYRYFAKQKKLLEDYGVQLIALKVLDGSSMDKATVGFTMRITNKANVEATIKKIYADVYLNDINVGYVATVTTALLPAKGSADINMQTTFSPKIVLKNIVELVLGTLAMKDVRYRLKGWVQIASGGFVSATVPFDESGSVKDFVNVPVTR